MLLIIIADNKSIAKYLHTSFGPTISIFTLLNMALYYNYIINYKKHHTSKYQSTLSNVTLFIYVFPILSKDSFYGACRLWYQWGDKVPVKHLCVSCYQCLDYQYICPLLHSKAIINTYHSLAHIHTHTHISFFFCAEIAGLLFGV